MSKKLKLSFQNLNNGFLVKNSSIDLGTFFRDTESFIENVLANDPSFVRLLSRAISGETSLVISLGKDLEKEDIKSKNSEKDKVKLKRPFLHPESEIAKRIANRKSVVLTSDFENGEIQFKSGEDLDEKLTGEKLEELNTIRKDVVIPADKFDPKIKFPVDPCIDFENNRITVTENNCFTNVEMQKLDLPTIFRSSGKSWNELRRISGTKEWFWTCLITKEERKGKPKFYHKSTRVIVTTVIKYLELLKSKNITEEEITIE